MEQLDPNDSRAIKRVLKKWTNRKERQAARRDPENAPKKRKYHGYSS